MMPDNTIAVFLIHADRYADPGRFEEALKQVSEYRRCKILRLKRPEDRRLSLAAGLALGAGLVSLGLREKDCEFMENPYGKPSIAGHPEIHFSLTHSGTLAACAFSGSPVGIDAEKIRAFSPQMRAHILRDGDPAAVGGSFSQISDGDPALTLIWTAKESYVKMLGTGLTAEPRKIALFAEEDCGFRRIEAPAGCAADPESLGNPFSRESFTTGFPVLFRGGVSLTKDETAGARTDGAGKESIWRRAYVESRLVGGMPLSLCSEKPFSANLFCGNEESRHGPK